MVGSHRANGFVTGQSIPCSDPGSAAHRFALRCAREKSKGVRMPPRLRIDRLLVERGLFESRAKAQAAIEAGLVHAGDALVRKPSEQIAVDAPLRATPGHPYVSRGGGKLPAPARR